MSGELEEDFTLDEVAAALRMSTRWVRERVREGAEHQRYGHKIRFTRAQVAQLRASRVKTPVEKSITTGRKRTRNQDGAVDIDRAVRQLIITTLLVGAAISLAGWHVPAFLTAALILFLFIGWIRAADERDRLRQINASLTRRLVRALQANARLSVTTGTITPDTSKFEAGMRKLREALLNDTHLTHHRTRS